MWNENPDTWSSITAQTCIVNPYLHAKHKHFKFFNVDFHDFCLFSYYFSYNIISHSHASLTLLAVNSLCKHLHKTSVAHRRILHHGSKRRKRVSQARPIPRSSSLSLSRRRCKRHHSNRRQSPNHNPNTVPEAMNSNWPHSNRPTISHCSTMTVEIWRTRRSPCRAWGVKTGRTNHTSNPLLYHISNHHQFFVSNVFWVKNLCKIYVLEFNDKKGARGSSLITHWNFLSRSSTRTAVLSRLRSRQRECQQRQQWSRKGRKRFCPQFLNFPSTTRSNSWSRSLAI